MSNLVNSKKIQGCDFVEETKEKKSFLKWKWIVLAAVAAIAVVFIIGAAFYSRHIYGRDTIFGVPVRNRTVAAVNDALKKKVADYTLTVKTMDGEEKITADQIGLSYQDNGAVSKLKDSQSALLWFTAPFAGKDELKVDVSYDEDMLRETMEAMQCMNESVIEEPVDAHLEYSDGSFQIVKEKDGNQPDSDKLLKALETCIREGKDTLDMDAAGCYNKPEITSDSEQLKKEQEEVNKLLDVKIVYDFKDRSETVDADQIAQWVVFGDDFSFSLDEDLVEQYEKELGYKYDTFGLTREFKTTSGNTVTLKGGDYGWCINKSKSAKALIEKIMAGESGTIEPIYLYTAEDRGINDIGGTYVEISIDQQHMWCYKDGKLVVDTPVVTGNVNIPGRETPRGGVWAIDAHATDWYLVGEGYRSHVNFWMPFNGNVGIHDSDWRDTYGGNIYKTNGSHGCVNTPYNAAKKIYETVTVGTPVVVY